MFPEMLQRLNSPANPEDIMFAYSRYNLVYPRRLTVAVLIRPACTEKSLEPPNPKPVIQPEQYQAQNQ
jgi:hypothetical protein